MVQTIHAGAINVTVEDLSPEISRQYLALNHPGQRPLSRAHVAAIAEALREDEWQEGLGDPIRFDRQNRLTDGQHRLAAAIQEGITLRNVVVIRGLPDSALSYIDVGRKVRNTVAIATMEGLTGDERPSNSELAAVGMELVNMDFSLKTTIGPHKKVEQYKGLPLPYRQELRVLNQTMKRERLHSGYVSAAAIRLARQHPTVWGFLDQALTNQIGGPSQAQMLHNALGRALKEKQDGPGTYRVVWFIFRAFSLWQAGVEQQRLKSPSTKAEDRDYQVFSSLSSFETRFKN